MGRVDHDRQVHHGVNVQVAGELSDRGMPRIGVDEVHLLQGADRIVYIAPEQVGNIRSEPPRDLSSEWVGHASDENPSRSHARIMDRYLEPLSRWPRAAPRARTPPGACRSACSPR